MKQITKKELAKELYEVVSSYENVTFATVYQKSFFTKENVFSCELYFISISIPS